ncbi:hypothetical protein A11A3_03564 [Alcanivorax hongdengensis A-11-3]|uniref:Choice-of-anchor I domain-containing protein n=1 Tax=Alcanivorax hongdengensis A-11-3 TaxID=1177179 RepID=L0WF06_9GAMM|nr:choice-of-anchor I family protein [Alcanivorax hongdengensis]EKF75403.1 hypothetical protein A11A3_03564 [Alcanivorax hongdengensis A-11-3]
MKQWLALGASLILAGSLAGCGGDSNDNTASDTGVATPDSIRLNFLGRYQTGEFDESAAEIPAYDAASQRAFVVNAEKGELDVLDMSDPAHPSFVQALSVADIAAGAEVNSVAVRGGLVAIAVEADPKTDPGYVAIYRADTLARLGYVQVGAQPDMVAFTADGKTVLSANEGEPSDDYQIDPEGSVSIIDISDTGNIVVTTADFHAFDSQADTLRSQGVRIYGPGASVSEDLEPEYIAVDDAGTTAWVTLQENNALAKVDIASATVTDIVALGSKDLAQADNAMDVSDKDDVINITTWAGVKSLYQPDAIHSFSANGSTYLVMANEGDARAWGEDDDAYWGTEGVGCAGDSSKGFVEEFRVKHLVHKDGFDRRCGDDLPPQLRDLAAGALLDPATFGYCGASAGDPGNCREDEELGRLNITWTLGYRTDSNGDPVLFDASGNESATGDRLMYDTLYAYGGRSFSIRDADGNLVFDSGHAIESYLASDSCMLGSGRDIPCKDYFNSGHDEGDAFDSRSDAKGPEPEGLTVGKIGDKTFLFLGLERMGGVLVYDITDPVAPQQVDYLNTRDNWSTEDPSTILSSVGDLGPEGLVFVPASESANGKNLLIVGFEVSGTTAVYEVEPLFD